MLLSIVLLLAAGWLGACSWHGGDKPLPEEPEQPVNEEVAIAFADSRSDVGESGSQTTKAASSTKAEPQKLTDNTIMAFTVHGFKNMTDNSRQTVFPGYVVKHDYKLEGTTYVPDTEKGWYYLFDLQTIKYWDFSADNYCFVAYTHVWNSAGNTSADTGTAEYLADGIKVSVPADATDETNPDVPVSTKSTPYVSELCVKNNDYITNQHTQPVTLTFTKPFCKVRFMFIGSDGKALTSSSSVVPHIGRTSLRFYPVSNSNIPYIGTVSLTYPLDGITTDINTHIESATEFYGALSIPYEESVDEANPVLVTNKANEKQWYTLLPNSRQGAYVMELSYSGSKRTAVVPAEYMNWQIGHQYTYVFKIDHTGMTFQPYLFVYNKWQQGYVGSEEW